MTTIGGLPAHVLLVHLVVVLVPLSAVLLLVVVASSRARRSLGVFTAALAVLALVSVPLTTDAGEWLEHRIPRTPLLRAHTQLGDSMLPWAAALALVAVLVVVTQRRGDRRSDSTRQPGAVEPHPADTRTRASRVTGLVLALLAVVVAVGSVVTVYRIGDSGARAAWTGQFSTQPLPRPAGQQHPAG
jgi:hypothetical protein